MGVLTLGLAACGGGSGSGPSGITTPPTTTPTTSPRGDRATTTISFLLPPSEAANSTSSSQRSPRFVSPGQDKVTLIVDGAKVLDRHKTDGTLAGTYTSPDGNTQMNVSYTNPQPPSLYYTFSVAIDTIPGKHTIGAEILGGSPAIILSEAQQSYTLAPGPNANATMTLKGVVGTGYIMCDTVAHDVENNGCANSFVSDTTSNTGGKYTLTAVAADFNSFPIADQGIALDNGAYSVYEKNPTGIVTIGVSGGDAPPWTTPGNQLQNAPSGGFFVATKSNYGHPFTVHCNKLGTTQLGIKNAQSGPIQPLAGQAYNLFDPSNNFPPQTGETPNYPDQGNDATGDKTPGNPNYHNGQNPNAVYNLVTVSCDASLNLTIN
ncbi:MAG TPA: hypothetical protein VGU66_19855 [Candidatus Elarobacter sp.]|nr:hypothetical protein [Candidatus Elarobacter sp.]